jgi:hypothetical protein
VHLNINRKPQYVIRRVAGRLRRLRGRIAGSEKQKPRRSRTR